MALGETEIQLELLLRAIGQIHVFCLPSYKYELRYKSRKLNFLKYYGRVFSCKYLLNINFIADSVIPLNLVVFILFSQSSALW